MKVLFVDTTTSDLVVAIVTQTEVFNFTKPAIGTRHSERLCHVVEEALASCNLGFADLTAYACAIGPGSFTGIRIGISTVKGYCLAVPKPLVEVNCLQAIATSNALGNVGKATIDAGNGYYFADYANSVEPCLVPYDSPMAQNAATAKNGSEYLDGAVSLVRNAVVGNNFSSDLHPLYIRRSQAEENKK